MAKLARILLSLALSFGAVLPAAAALVTYHFTGTTLPGTITRLDGGLPFAAELVVDDATAPNPLGSTEAQYTDAVQGGFLAVGNARYSVGLSLIDIQNDNPVAGVFVDDLALSLQLFGPALPGLGAPQGFDISFATVSAAPDGPLGSVALADPWLPASVFATTRGQFGFFSGVPTETLAITAVLGPAPGPLPGALREPGSLPLAAGALGLACCLLPLRRVTRNREPIGAAGSEHRTKKNGPPHRRRWGPAGVIARALRYPT